MPVMSRTGALAPQRPFLFNTPVFACLFVISHSPLRRVGVRPVRLSLPFVRTQRSLAVRVREASAVYRWCAPLGPPTRISFMTTDSITRQSRPQPQPQPQPQFQPAGNRVVSSHLYMMRAPTNVPRQAVDQWWWWGTNVVQPCDMLHQLARDEKQSSHIRYDMI